MSAPNNELNSEHLLQISDEVSRIATALAQLSKPGQTPAPMLSANGTTPLDVPVASVRAVIRARRLRSEFLADDLFADPAWDMMLSLFEAELSHRRIAVSALCNEASVPPTTALRWIHALCDPSKALFVRKGDPLDGRRYFVELTPETSLALRQYFNAIDKPDVI
jgi:DNA-binding MarR family transcriptional regulator